MKIKYEIVEKNILNFFKKYIEFKLNEIDEKYHEFYIDDPIVLFNYIHDEIKKENENYELIDVLNQIIELCNNTIKKYELNVDELNKIDELI